MRARALAHLHYCERSIQMKHRLKKLRDQVIVITGASSGIGLTTARHAAQQGAKLVLASRNDEALGELTDELRAQGAEVIHVVADVGKEEEVRAIARMAIQRFGRFDTWVNNAGVSIYGRVEQIPIEDQRRLFETNFWGVVHGSVVAVDHLKQHGGALINLGSEVSDVAVPLQGIYSASKHAVKGFTDSLRIELEHEGAPVSVTLVKPAAIDTLFVPHAKNFMDVEPRLPPPIYAPSLVANAILLAAQHPQRDIFVGGAAKFFSSAAHYAPRMLDRYMKHFMFRQQQRDEPARDREHNALYAPSTNPLRSMGEGSRVWRSSVYTRAATHPKITTSLLLLGSLAIAASWRLLRKPDLRGQDWRRRVSMP
jgi:short-subunit dehydrogenase